MFLNFSMFFAFIVTGLIATLFFELVRGRRVRNGVLFVVASLIFDFFILAINMTFLYVVKDVFTVGDLLVYFNCMSFTVKYMMMSVFVGIVIASIAGAISRSLFFRLFFRVIEN